MADRIGQQLGNYRLVRLLGRGAFAEVYLGEHRYLKSYAALKVLRLSLTDKEAKRFLSEAQTLVRMTHPNIVRVLEFAIDRGTPVLVMDYAVGGTLRQHHPRGSHLPLATTVDYVKQVAAALQYAHNRNIIHRDVKPENILLGSNQQILLSDFGLALLTPSPELLSTQEMAGTLPYTAPEQLQGKPLFASDQYALGIVTYEWLCGRRPFEGNQWDIMRQHISVAPPPLREIYPELPAEIEATVLRALAKEPKERFVSVQAFALALERASQEHHLDDEDSEEITVQLKEVFPAPFVAPPGHSPSDSQTARKVFLSAAPADDALAARLKADLGKRGVLLSNDQLGDAVHALDSEDAVRQAIRAAQVALVVVSPHTRSSRVVKEHLRITMMYKRRLVLVWAAGDDIAALLLDEWGQTGMIDVIDARHTRYETALDEIVACLKEDAPASPLLESPFSTLSGEPRNPYKGLRAFTKHDAVDFFGRDRLIEEMVVTLQDMFAAEKPGMPGTRLLTAIGPSGSGKSSVVMAGLLPRLQQGTLTGSEEWLYLDPIVPGKHPFEALALSLASHLLERSVKTIREDLEDDSGRGLHLLATQLVKRSAARVILLIDQFEELFAHTVTEGERQRFIDLLLAAVREPQGQVVVLLTLRADFYDRPMQYPELSRLIEAHHISVLLMELEDLRTIIEQPAALQDVQLTFEGNLVGDLLFEAQGQPGALPLLEFTLDQLFQQRDGHWLTFEAYQKIGGVKGALTKHAESTYASLPSDEHRKLARALFLRLIDPGETAQDTTRRRAALTEFSLPDPKQTTMICAVADAFVAARLLTTNEIAGTTTIEVSHEALIREWTRLSDWLREAHEDISLQQTLSADAADWLRRGRPADRLYRGTELIEAQAWSERNIPSTDEVAFLQASIAEHERQKVQEQSRQARELNLQRRIVSRQRLLIAALSIFSVIVIVLASVAQLNFVQAKQEKQFADSRALAANASYSLAQHELDLALLLGAKATQTADTYEARNSLLSSLEESPQIVTMIHNESSPIPILTLTFGSDGRTLVASHGYSVYVWDTQTRKNYALPLANQDYVGGVALSPDGQTLAISNAAGVWLRNIQTSTTPGFPLDGGIQGLPTGLEPTTPLAFSPDGQLVASARCKQYSTSQDTPVCVQTQVSVWNVLSRQPIILPFVVQGDVKNIAFSPDGTILASASDKGVQLWKVATGQLFDTSLVDNAAANSVAFNSDGTILASGGSDGLVRLWKVPSGQLAVPLLQGHTDSITNVAFSPDGTILASSSTDTTVRLWDVASGQLHLKLNGDGQPKTSLAFRSDGKTLASGSGNGTILLWNIRAESTVSQQLADTGGASTPLFSSNGTLLLTGSADGKIVVQEVKTGQIIDTIDTTIAALLHPQNAQGPNLRSVQSLALTRDGAILASGRRDGTIILWDMKTKRPVARFPYPNLLAKVMLSSDGQILAAAGDGGRIIVWNVATRAILLSRSYPTNYPLSAALSPDGKLLAVGSCGKISNGSCAQGQVQLWNVKTGKLAGQPLFGHHFAVVGLAFNPDG